ncbi:hypothetical protein F5887DRAFT_1082486 [Amanita rubescens]|nr:hypothetical protein F5887DRAFT_1082486 [Amanita rubescens]
MSASPEVLVNWEHKNIIFHVILSGMALQYYDFFQTIELEVEYIWKARFNLLKFTYLFTKYLPYVDVPLLAGACFLFDVEKL